jgi:hypothetical protein
MMPDSPLSVLLDKLDELDVDSVISQLAPGGDLLRTDGRVADGIDQVRESLNEFVAPLRATTHSITAEWHPEEGVWIAELDAGYELRDGERHGPYKRVAVLRTGEGGITSLHFYGSHELPLTSHLPYREVRAGTHWLPTL